VNSETVPFISIPKPLLQAGVKLGDLVVVSYKLARCGAIVADVGPAKHIGEGSIALADALGIKSDPRQGGRSTGVSYCIYLGSASSPPWPRADVSAAALRLANDLAFT
jgi:hypothetical protein